MFPAAGLVGDEIALRINDIGPGTETWKSTTWLDNVSVAVPDFAVYPATIVGISSLPGNIMRIVIDAPSAAEKYWPKTTTNLISGNWEGVPHSVDGSAPWLVTNLSYVTEFESGTNEVIYVQDDVATRFFGIGE